MYIYYLQTLQLLGLPLDEWRTNWNDIRRRRRRRKRKRKRRREAEGKVFSPTSLSLKLDPRNTWSPSTLAKMPILFIWSTTWPKCWYPNSKDWMVINISFDFFLFKNVEIFQNSKRDFFLLLCQQTSQFKTIDSNHLYFCGEISFLFCCTTCLNINQK